VPQRERQGKHHDEVGWDVDVDHDVDERGADDELEHARVDRASHRAVRSR
jgi:hypothetical protein